MRYNSNDFTYNAQTQVFSAEASDLTQGHAQPLFGYVIWGSDQLGLVMVSSRTGNAVRFVVTNVVRNPDFDIEYWELAAVRADWMRHRGAVNCTVKIFND